jgi:hypothetical protein
MGWFILAQVFSILITIVSIGRLSEQEKDLEILILRQQLAILQSKQDKPVKPKRAEKMTLAVLTAKLKEVTQRPAGQLRWFIRPNRRQCLAGIANWCAGCGAMPAEKYDLGYFRAPGWHVGATFQSD